MIIIHSSIKHNFVTVVSKLSKGKIPSESDVTMTMATILNSFASQILNSIFFNIK